MRKIVFLVALVALIMSCNQTPDNLIKVTGTILNPDASELMFYVDRKPDTVAVAEDGTFTFEMEAEKGMTANIIYGKKRASVYMAPKKSLDLTVDVNDWDNSLGFDGDLQSVNEYLLDKGIEQMSWGRNYIQNFSKSPEDFRISRDSMQNIFTGLLEEYKSNGMDEDFAATEQISLTYSYYGDLNNFPSAHKYYTKVDEVELPEDWYDFADNMDLNDPLLIEVDQAMYFLSSFVNSEAIKAANLGDNAYGTPELLQAKVDFINATFNSAEMKERFIFENVSSQLDGGPATGVEALIENYLATSTNEENKATVQEKVDGWNSILPGKDAPAWTLPDIDGKTLSLADLKGKYVYIDFWATWCGPCIAEIPHYRELVKEYAGKNVQFISISVDRDKPAWEKMVKEEAFEWTQLHDGEMMNDDYLVKYIPTFVLIDTEGKIIDPRAPRPSEQKLRDLLDAQPNI